jgi:response regulator RpfG family c-di-GMP phosphodiesterase
LRVRLIFLVLLAVIPALALLVYSDLNHHRRAALAVETALAEIWQKRGVLYDPEVADACLHYFQEQPKLVASRRRKSKLVGVSPAR